LYPVVWAILLLDMAEYFSHDYDAREDEKIQELLFELKMEGYGVYWSIIEMLYKNDGYLQLNYERIAYALHSHNDTVKSVINDFDLFKLHGDNFTSTSVLHRIKLRKGKSATARKAAKIRWGKEKANDADAMQTQCEGNAKKKSKVKEKKEKKINIEFDIFWNLYDKKVGDNKSCEKKWNNLKDEQRDKIIKTIPKFIQQFEDKQFQPYPYTYLNGERWNDEVEATKQNSSFD